MGDVWQVGVCLWMLVFREYPVMRNLNSERRITADEIMQHEWIQDHCPTSTEENDNGIISPFSITVSVQEETFTQAKNACAHFDSVSVDSGLLSSSAMDIEF